MGFLEYTKWVIVNKQGDPWSDDWGWVDQNGSFSVYNDRKGILPMEGKWMAFKDYRRKWLQARINALDLPIHYPGADIPIPSGKPTYNNRNK